MTVGILLLLAFTDPCEHLTSLTIQDAVVNSAENVAATASLPGHCRVRLTSRPVSDSEIHVEIWLPALQAWNGKLLGTGNGGYSSALTFPAMQNALKEGYATAGSDTGHEGGDLKFGLGHPEKINDWGYRATHVMTGSAKLVVRNYYGRFAKYAYFTGCSTGGHQALMEAQRYPDDYDGIVAGDPGNNRVRLNIGFLWSWLKARPLPASKLAMLNRAVIERCDAQDGLKDGLIADPRRCGFDPSRLLCKGGDEADCLTPAQVEGVRAIYDGARNPRTGAQVFAGWPKGSEAGWAAYFVGQPQAARLEFWRYWVFGDPEWNPLTFDFDRDVAFADARMSSISAVDPNLAAFRARNGKLLLYHGWADAVSPPDETIRYFGEVQRASGGARAAAAFARLFMAPGMGHCSGGPGPNTFDALGALDKWVSQGVAPDKIIASHSSNGVVDRTRPLCAYPQVAVWNGKGSSDDAAQFVCQMEGKK